MIATLAAAAIAGALASPTPCRAALPEGPAVPAPIVVKTSCGGFRLATDGRVTRLARGWFAAHSDGTGRRYGVDLHLRRDRAGRITLLRAGRTVWRSQGLYPNDAADVAFGPGAFAFSSYRRGLFLTDLEGPERLVIPGRGRYPYDFFASGRLIAASGGTITVLSHGRVEHRYSYSRRGGLAFAGDGNTLYFVTPGGRLATLQDSRLRVGRRVGLDGMISFSDPGLLLFYGARSFTVTALDGRVIAQARWPRSRLGILDSGASVSPDGRQIAFRLSDARAGARKGTAVLQLLGAGDTRAAPIYRHPLGRVGCGVGANMSWSGRHLLYRSADGEVAIVGAGERRLDLQTLVEALPHRSGEQPTVAWLGDYPGP